MEKTKYKTEWDLSDFYNSITDKQIDKDTQKIISLTEQFTKTYKGKINKLKEKDFLTLFQDEDQITHTINKIGTYLTLLFSKNTQDQQIIKKLAEFENTLTEISNKLLFLSQELKLLGEKKLLQLSQSQELKKYKNYFKKTADNIKYILDEKTEYALNLKENSGGSAFQKLYEELTSSFLFKIKIDGKTKELNDAQIRSLKTHPKEEIRKSAYDAIQQVYANKQNQITLSNTYLAIVKDWTSDVKLRKYASVISPRNKSEELDDETVSLLLTEIEKSYPLYHRFLKTKAKILNKKKIEPWNIYAPVSKTETKHPFQKSIQILLETLKEFDEESHNYAKEMLKTGRIDVYPKKGKRTGGFTLYFPKIRNYIMLNHTNKIKDTLALAHEMGHAIHALLSQKQPLQTFDPQKSIAETASLFTETLIAKKIIQKITKSEKTNLLNNLLETIFLNLHSTVMAANFEKQTYQSILKEKEPTLNEINQTYRKEKTKLFGKTIKFTIPEEKETSWMTSPHLFLSPFYNYPYTFGTLISLTLHQQYKKQGKPFIKIYKNILSSGGSLPPEELLKQNGIDIKSKEFYQNALKTVEELLTEFETLAK